MAPKAPPPTAHTLSLSHLGHIRGLTHHSASPPHRPISHTYHGIPYALPPTGPHRWARPRPLAPCHRYGTEANPGDFGGACGLCPQPGWGGRGEDGVRGGEDGEDCLQVNVWVPVGEKPAGGWPVFFYIHGGWLQFGSPNGNDFSPLLEETELQCIFVLLRRVISVSRGCCKCKTNTHADIGHRMPAYRLNLFGFLASEQLEAEAAKKGQTSGNYGFWDQRMALEWTHKYITYFGGNAANITVAGYSAGAHSAFQQLAHDLFHPNPAKHIIKRAIMFSNGSGMQPKALAESHQQFTALVAALSLPPSLPHATLLARLRALPPSSLLAATAKLPIHEFRAFSDGQFVRTDLFHLIETGAFAARMRARGVHLLTGDCRDERFVYGAWRPPSVRHEASLAGLAARLRADYPAKAVEALMPLYCPRGELPVYRGTKCKSWDEAFGVVYADLQVHALQRGFVEALCRGGAGSLVHRYRIEWRAACVDAAMPKEWGVTHGTDVAIWFWGNGMGPEGIREGEKGLLKRFLKPFMGFVKGEEVDWEANAPKELRRLRSDGETDTWVDEDWERGQKVWNVVKDALHGSERAAKEKL